MSKINPAANTKPLRQLSRKRSARLYCIITALMFIAGLAPMAANLVLDPFEMHSLLDLGVDKKPISEKAHYPLWKTIHFPQQTSRIVVIGDSRARALQDKYWHELGLTNAYNFAYGGVTLYEIRDTFNYVRDHHENLKTLIVGIQLRSFDLDHKQGMNRVPEAVRLVENPFDYYSSWFVLRTGVQAFDHTYGSSFEGLVAGLPKLSSAAHADTAGALNSTNLRELLEPVICENCLLPEKVAPQLHASSASIDYLYPDKLGLWGELWRTGSIARTLPPKFDKQIRLNARSDWRSFEFSELFWSWLEDMSRWSKESGIQLIFFIPPTILEMQNVQSEFGHAKLNHEFRLRLASLATVVDFDFDNPLTRDLTRFRDAYHFNARTSKLIIAELAQVAGQESGAAEQALARSRKRRQDIICPVTDEDIHRKIEDNHTIALEGLSCRIWRSKNG